MNRNLPATTDNAWRARWWLRAVCGGYTEEPMSFKVFMEVEAGRYVPLLTLKGLCEELGLGVEEPKEQ